MRSKKIEATEKAIGGRVWWDIFERICKVVLWPKHFKDYRHTPVYLCREVPSFQERFCVCSASELKVMALEFSGRAAKMRRKLRKLCFIKGSLAQQLPIYERHLSKVKSSRVESSRVESSRIVSSRVESSRVSQVE